MPWKNGTFTNEPPKWRWTPDYTDTLRAMWADGRSMRQIGDSIGTTRSAVASKISRLGLQHQHQNGYEPPAPLPNPPPEIPAPKPPVIWKPNGGCSELRPDGNKCGRTTQPGRPACAEHLTERYHRDKVTG